MDNVITMPDGKRIPILPCAGGCGQERANGSKCSRCIMRDEKAARSNRG